MALNKYLILFFTILFSLNSQALDCRLIDKFSDPGLANNTQFWDELGKLSNQSDEAVAALIKKHDSKFSFSNSASKIEKNFKIPQSLNISKKSQKAIKLLNSNQTKNFEEFVSTISGKDGLKAIYSKPGKWHLEKLKQYGGNSSVRLDNGMRVLFKGDGKNLEILDIGSHIGH